MSTTQYVRGEDGTTVYVLYNVRLRQIDPTKEISSTFQVRDFAIVYDTRYGAQTLALQARNFMCQQLDKVLIGQVIPEIHFSLGGSYSEKHKKHFNKLITQHIKTA